MKREYSNILVEFYEKMSSWENGVVHGRDISLPQMHLIEVVGNHSEIRMKELSQILGVTTGTLTVMIHRLLKKDYIKKVVDENDKRSYFIALTAKGEEEYQIHHDMHFHLIDEIVDRLGEEKSSLFFEILKEVQGVM